MTDTLENTLAEIGQAVEELKASTKAELDEIKAKGAADPLLVEKVEKLHGRLNELDELKTAQELAKKLDDRVGEMEARLQLMGTKKGENMISAEEREHLDAFRKLFGGPADEERKAALQAAERKAFAAMSVEQKTVATLTGGAGGYAVPEVISRMVDEKLQDYSPVRQLVDVVPVGTSDYHELVDVNGESYEWVGEGDTRNQQTEPQLEEVVPTMGTVNAYYWANEEAVDDMFINVEAWLARAAIRAFTRAEGLAFVSGNGTKKPTGFLNATPEAAGDEDSPARTFGALQYIPSGAAGAFAPLSLTSPVSHPDDALIDMVHALKSGYTAGASWLMNRATMGAARKLRDADGRPLWQDSLIAGQPPALHGFPVIEVPDMPNIGANTFPIAFGNWRECYLFVERHGMRVTPDMVTAPGRIKWNFRRRLGGKTRNDDAAKLLKMAVS